MREDRKRVGESLDKTIDRFLRPPRNNFISCLDPSSSHLLSSFPERNRIKISLLRAALQVPPSPDLVLRSLWNASTVVSAPRPSPETSSCPVHIRRFEETLRLPIPSPFRSVLQRPTSFNSDTRRFSTLPLVVLPGSRRVRLMLLLRAEATP